MEYIFEADLHRFDGAAAGGEGTGTAEGTPADAAADPAPAETETPQETQEDRQARYKQMLEEFRDLDEARMRETVRRRTLGAAQASARAEALDAAVAPLYAAHGLEPGDVEGLARAIAGDNSYWERGAEEAGMTVEQYRQMKQTQAENARLRAAQQRAESEAAAEQQYRKWLAEAEEMKTDYPEFDLTAELENPLFISLITSKNELTRLPIKAAYEACHLDEMRHKAAQNAAKNTETRITQDIRAGGRRPAESAAGNAAGAHTGRVDVAKLTRAEREAFEKRAMRGEHITFRND